MAFDGRYRETQRGGGFGSSAGSGDGPEAGGAANVLQELDGELVKFRGCIDSVGTQFDNSENRREIKRLRSVIKAKVVECQTQLKYSKKAKDPQSKIMFDRQSNQLETQISTFQTLLDKEKSAVKANPAPTGQSDEDNGGFQEERGGGFGGGMQAQSHMQRQGQLEEREEQERELRELERDIVDLHDIHKDVGIMVQDQGQHIDRIDHNVSQAQVRTEHGKHELQQAVVTVSKNRRLKIIIACIVGGVVLAILIVIIVLLAVFVPRGN